jgi:hypothetical protein
MRVEKRKRHIRKDVACGMREREVRTSAEEIDSAENLTQDGWTNRLEKRNE